MHGSLLVGRDDNIFSLVYVWGNIINRSLRIIFFVLILGNTSDNQTWKLMKVMVPIQIYVVSIVIGYIRFDDK